MSQTSYLQMVNEPGLAFRGHLNETLAALNTDFQGNTAPTTTVAYMTWLDSSTIPPTLRRRNSANTAWDVVDFNTNVRTVDSVTALKGLDKTKHTRVFVTGYYTSGDGGGGHYWYDSSDTTTTDNGGTTIVATDGGRWKLMIQGGTISLAQFGAQPGQDIRTKLQAAVDASPGTHDLTTAYIYAPTWKIIIPEGNYTWTAGRVTITKNNIKIVGAGQFNTVIKCPNTLQISEMIRFKGAYACELSHLTLDGGLPFTPTGTETYGVDIPLVLDQCAHFQSYCLNICNYRYEGKRCIHLWESYFEDLRIFNGGFFGDGTNRSAGIRYTSAGKEETTFPGGESNNVVYNKVAFGTVGSYVSADEVPTFNIFFNDVIAEGRTWTTQYTSSGEIKWRIGGTSSNFVIDGGYSFPHAQPYNANTTLFDFSNVSAGCRVRNYRVYLSKDNTYQEVSNIISCDSNYLVEFDVDVEEIGSNVVTLLNASSISNVSGSLAYKTDQTRVRSSLFAGTSEVRFAGSLFLRDTSGASSHKYFSNATKYKTVGSETTVRPTVDCIAIAKVDGRVTGGVLHAQNLTYSRTSTGVYVFTFTQALPDANYVVNVSANILNNTAEKPEIDNQTNTSFTVANRAGATYYDPSIVNVTVFR